MRLPFVGLLIFCIFSVITASTKAAGAIWLLLFLLGLVLFILNFKRTKHDVDNTQISIKLAQHWALFCIAAAILIFIPTAYWGGPWPERHPQWRLLIAALGTYWVVKHANLTDLEWSRLLLWMLMGISVSLAIAFVGVVVWGSTVLAPTNRIPWMAGISVLVCAAMAMVFELKSISIYAKKIVIVCVLLTVVTVMFSGVRGSWPLIFVLPALLLALNHIQHKEARTHLVYLWIIPFTALILSAGSFAAEDPWPRLQIAMHEIYAALLNQNHAAADFNSSVGIRLGMYWLGLENALNAGVIGYGHDAHKQMFFEIFQKLGAESFAGHLSHYHNDILNPWVEFGLMGLLSYLCYSYGLIYMAKKLWGLHRSSSIGLIAILAMHLSTGFTNTNFAHNYYPLMLSLSVALILLAVNASESQTKEK